jgi:hypothetical protein
MTCFPGSSKTFRITCRTEHFLIIGYSGIRFGKLCQILRGTRIQSLSLQVSLRITILGAILIVLEYTAEQMKWCETPAVSTAEVGCIHSISKDAGGEIMSCKTSRGDKAEIVCRRQRFTFKREYRSHAS